MSKDVECPCCLGTGEIVLRGKYKKKCNICEGTGKTSSEIAEDYIHSINVNYTDTNEDFFDY